MDRLPDEPEHDPVSGGAECPHEHLAALRAELDRLHQDGYLRRVCLRFVRNPHDAEDAVGEVYLRACANLHRFHGGSTLKTWLYQVASRHCLNRLRSKKPDQWDDAVMQQVEDDAPRASESVDGSVLYRQLLALIEERARHGDRPWDPHDFLIFQAYFSEEDPKWKVVAAVVGLHIEVAKYHFHRHVLRLLKEVGADVERDP